MSVYIFFNVSLCLNVSFLLMIQSKHSHKKKYSRETCAGLLFMLLQDFFAIARPHRVHTIFFFTKECCALFVLPKIK